MILNTTTVPSTSEKPVVMSGQNNKFDDINVLDMKKLYYWWEFVFEFYWGLNLVITYQCLSSLHVCNYNFVYDRKRRWKICISKSKLN